jgi:hypothetical protein
VAEIKTGARLVEVLGSRSDERIGIGGIDILGRLANDIAVEKRHWLAESNCANDEGDEQERVNTSHDEEAEVGVRPVVADADHDVECGDAGLVAVSDVVVRWAGVTHHTERADKLLWRLDTSSDDHLHEVGSDANDDDHADGLQDADGQEHLAQRHGTVAWDRHIG